MRMGSTSLEGTPFEGMYSMVKARELCPPEVCVEQLVVSLFRSLRLPEPVYHWFHPVSAVLLISLIAGFGLKQGLDMRASRTGKMDVSQSDLRSARSFHPSLMAGLAVVYLISSQGGLGSLLVLQQPILESPHSATALLSFLMLAIQGTLSLGINTIPNMRTVHYYFGCATMASIAAHAATGLALGFSF
jgi:hypothetical protein